VKSAFAFRAGLIGLAVLTTLAATFTVGWTAVESPDVRSLAPSPPRSAIDRQSVAIVARHSERAKIGDLAGLLVTIENRSGTPLDRIRISVSRDYFDGLELRRTEPGAAIVDRADRRELTFAGPRDGVRFGYLLTLTPVTPGDYLAEVSVAAVDAAGHETLLAIYDIATTVSNPG
jgi:hypothetical protein